MRSVQVLMWVIVLLLGCVEPYDFQVEETSEILVVEAEFSNLSTKHKVKLSVSSALDETATTPLSGADVWIVENNNTQIDLTETDSGVYETAATVAGKVGSQYVLNIKLSDGSTFQSSAETLISPAPIDSVWGRFMELPSEEDNEFIRGIQLFVDTHDDTRESSYFRYDYEEDFEAIAAYPSRQEWDYDNEIYVTRDVDIGVCYDHAQSQGVIVSTTNGLSENRLSEFPIRMLRESGYELIGNYAIILRQYHLTASAFQYYKNLKENNESAGSFFDKQKGSIVGNIASADQTRKVLGFFEVAGVSSDTSFFHPSDFYHQGFKPDFYYRGNCGSEDIEQVTPGELSNEVMQSRNIIFVDEIVGIAYLTSVPCSDCRVYADLKKPDYWD